MRRAPIGLVGLSALLVAGAVWAASGGAAHSEQATAAGARPDQGTPPFPTVPPTPPLPTLPPDVPTPSFLTPTPTPSPTPTNSPTSTRTPTPTVTPSPAGVFLPRVLWGEAGPVPSVSPEPNASPS